MDGGRFSINFSKRATGHCSGVAHIFGRKGRQPPCLPISGLGVTLVKYDILQTITVRLDAEVTKCELVMLISSSHTYVHGQKEPYRVLKVLR